MVRKKLMMFTATMCLTMTMCVGVSASQSDKTTTAIPLTKYSDLDTKSQDFDSGTIYGEFKADAGQASTVKEETYKIICPADGKYRINLNVVSRGDESVWGDNRHAKYTLYSNPICTKVVMETKEKNNTESEDVFMDLTKGTYYMKVEPSIEGEDKNVDVTYSVSFGYLPANTEFIKVVKTYDKVNKAVVLNITGLDAKSLKIKDGVHTAGWELSGILWEDCPDITTGKTMIKKDDSYTIRMEDSYGNKYGKAITINDFAVPSVPTVRSYRSGTKAVSGVAVANSTVKVTVGKKTYTTKSDRRGFWSVKTSTLKVGTKISATVTSIFDKVSAKANVTVKNQKLAKPKVTTYKKKTKYVKGTAKKNTTAYVKIGKKTYKAKVNKKGKFSVKVSKLKAGTKITVTIKDEHQNYSNSVTVKVKK